MVGRKKHRKPVLIIQHAPHEHPAALRRALESQGIRTLWIHPYRGEHYPAVTEIEGMVSLGGPMGANDQTLHPWINAECELLKACALGQKPVVGICLGAQMMAKALGGSVEPNPVAEVGWFPIALNKEGQSDPIAGAAGAGPTVYHWHGDTFHLPEGAVLLGNSKACARQAYRFGDQAYGFQFHPEADHQLVLEWLAIEGIEEEIRETQEIHGTTTVQDAQTQRHQALRGEKGSLKITAAIGALFRKHEYPATKKNVREKISAYVAQRTTLVVEFEGPDSIHLRLKGLIISHLVIPAGDFIIFQEENTLLWPIRIGDIKKLAVFRG